MEGIVEAHFQGLAGPVDGALPVAEYGTRPGDLELRSAVVGLHTHRRSQMLLTLVESSGRREELRQIRVIVDGPILPGHLVLELRDGLTCELSHLPGVAGGRQNRRHIEDAPPLGGVQVLLPNQRQVSTKVEKRHLRFARRSQGIAHIRQGVGMLRFQLERPFKDFLRLVHSPLNRQRPRLW